MNETYNPETGHFHRKDKRIDKCNNNKGYHMVRYNGKYMRAHKAAFIAMGVEIPDHLEIDHINRIKNDNRWSNLRLVTKSENCQNVGVRKDNKLGIKNLTATDFQGYKYVYQKMIQGKKTCKRFYTFEDAIEWMKVHATKSLADSGFLP